MPEVPCPIPGCEYKTPDVDASVVVELIKAHSAIHPAVAAAVAKVECVRKPTKLQLQALRKTGPTFNRDTQTVYSSVRPIIFSGGFRGGSGGSLEPPSGTKLFHFHGEI